MKLLYTFVCIVLASCTHNDTRKHFTDRSDTTYTKFSGNFNYTKSQFESAQNRAGVEVKKPLYTTKDKKQMYYIGGSVYHNHDVFKKVFFVNGFGQAGVEF